MLHALQLERTPVFRVRDLSAELQEVIPAHTIGARESNRTNAFLDTVTSANTYSENPSRRIRWNTQAQTAGYATFVERTAKRRRKN